MAGDRFREGCRLPQQHRDGPFGLRAERIPGLLSLQKGKDGQHLFGRSAREDPAMTLWPG